MSIETNRSVSRVDVLTLWAGRLIVAIALVHIAFFVAVSWDHLPGWFAGDLWVTPDLDAPMSASEGYFWALLGSFAIPLLLLGALVTRFAREGRALPAYVTWGIAAWVVACTYVLAPSGFPLGLVPAGLLIAAALRRSSAPRSGRAEAMPARETSST